MTEGSIDDIWKSMKEMDQQSKKEYKARFDFRHAHSDTPMEIKVNKAKTKKTSTDSAKTKKKEKKVKATDFITSSSAETPLSSSGADPITATDFLQRHSRDIHATDAESSRARRDALMSLLDSLTGHTLSTSDANEVLDALSKPLFKRFADSNEKCRELSFRITISLFMSASDFVPILPYFMPALLQRLPAGYMYDEELKIFVSNYDLHDAYKRGRAVERQDKVSGSVNIVETAEEIRLLHCKAILTLLQSVTKYESYSILHPYFNELILFTQAQLLDVFPEVKYIACQIILLLCPAEEYELGMKYFAMGLVRAVFPVLRHRHARVRALAVEALQACIMIPDRAKRKGAGSDAIVDLVGFREDNVLPIASFYKADVQINYLAELTTDTSALVREKVATLISTLMTALEDKYDHFTRLLPYLLDFLHDIPSVATIALDCLLACGKQYEEDHHDDVLEKKQYGVDGDLKINLSKPMLPPFTTRPPIGVRLFVRGNTKRFLIALLNELTNWQSHIRVKSAHLLKTIVFLCEEHLTMEMYSVLPLLFKSYNVAKGDSEKEVITALHEVCELMGRYISPEVYLHFLLPRLAGSAEVSDNIDTASKCNLLQILKCFLSGTKDSVCVQYLQQVVEVVTDSYVIDFDSVTLQTGACDVLLELLQKCENKFGTAVEAHYQSTGRLTTLRAMIQTIFGFLLKVLHVSSLNTTALQCVTLLSKLSMNTHTVYTLYETHTPELLRAVIPQDESRILYPASEEFAILQSLVQCPYCEVQSRTELLKTVLEYTIRVAKCLQQEEDAEEQNLLLAHSQLVVSCLTPIFASIPKLDAIYTQFYDYAERRATTAVAVAPTNALIQGVTECYLLSPVWQKSGQLSQQRMHLLSLLLFGSTLSQLPTSVTPFLFDFSTSFMSYYGVSILEAVLIPSMQPAIVDNMRHQTVLLLQHVFHLLHSQCVFDVDIALQEERRKIMYDSEIPSLAVRHLLTMLNDSYDSIRIDALIALQYSMDYVHYMNRVADVSLPDHLTLENLWAVLHVKIVHGTPTPLFLDHLNDLLRSVAIINPVQMEALVRQALPSAKPEEVSVYSSLVDHCGVLTDLQQLKKTDK